MKQVVLIFFLCSLFSNVVLSTDTGVAIWSGQVKNTIVIGTMDYSNQTTIPMITLDGYTYPGDQQFSSFNYIDNVLTIVATNQESNQMDLITINCSQWDIGSILPIQQHLTLGGLAYSSSFENDPNNLFITIFNFGLLKVIKMNPYTGQNLTVDQFPGVFQSAVYNSDTNYYAVSYVNHTITNSLSNNYIKYYFYSSNNTIASMQSFKLSFTPMISIYTFGPYKMRYHKSISQVIGLLQYFNPNGGQMNQVFSSLTSSSSIQISDMISKPSLYIISILPSPTSSLVYTIAQNMDKFYFIIINYSQNTIQDIIPISQPIVEIF